MRRPPPTPIWMKPGDKVEFIVSHGCTTINLHDRYFAAYFKSQAAKLRRVVAERSDANTTLRRELLGEESP